MGLYGVAPIDDSAKKKKPYDFFQPAKVEAPAPENHYNLPSSKEPVAASAIVPVGPSYAVVPVGQTSNSVSAPSFSTSAPDEQDPALEYLRNSLDALKATQDAPVQKENRFKAALHVAAAALSQTPGGNTWADVARQVGSAAGGAISGVVQPKLPGAIKKLYNVHQAEEDVVRAEKYANTASNVARRNAQTDLGYSNLAERQKAGETRSLTSRQRILLAQLDRLGYVDPGNPTHARLLNQAKEAGLNVDPTAYNAARGKGQPRVEIETPDGHLKYTLQRDPKGDWKYVETPEGAKAVTGVGEARNVDTGETLSSEKRRLFEREKFEFSKVIQTYNAQVRAAQLQATTDAVNQKKSEYDADIEGKRAKGYALQSAAAEIERGIADNDKRPFSQQLDAGDVEKLRKDAREKRAEATSLFAEVDKAPQGGLNVNVPAPPLGKSVTPQSLKSMSEPDFRNYLKTATPPYSAQEIEERVKRWKKMPK